MLLFSFTLPHRHDGPGHDDADLGFAGRNKLSSRNAKRCRLRKCPHRASTRRSGLICNAFLIISGAS